MTPSFVEIDPQEDAALYEPVRRLTTDMRRAAETMGDAEVRYLIDLFYAIQESRKRGDNQLRAASQDHEPNLFIAYMAQQVTALEGICNSALQIVAMRTRTGRWLMSLKGISGVLTAGLLAGLDIRRAPTAASFWRFCGLDPSWEWLGKERAEKLYNELREVSGLRRAVELLPLAARRVNTPEEGLLARVERQTRPRDDRQTVRPLDAVRDTLTRTQLVKALATRPWNAQLKTLQWKLTDCLVKVQNRDGAPYYCLIYQQRKVQEWQHNLAGHFAHLCPEALTRKLTELQRPWYAGLYEAQGLKAQYQQGLQPSAWVLPEPQAGGTPMLPPGRIELRARRMAAKKLLADLHYCLWEDTYGAPPLPSPEQQRRGYTRWRVPPGWRETI